MNYTVRIMLVVAVLGCYSRSRLEAATITSTRNENINTNTMNNPFFSNNLDSNYQGSVTTNTSMTSTVSGQDISVTGNSTLGSAFTDGNGIPDGVVVTFDVQFVITATTGGNLTHAAISTGDGLGISGGANANQLNVEDTVNFSSITISNAAVTADPNGYLLDSSVTVDNPLWRVVRSANFNNMTEGARASSDAAATADVTGFGVVGGGHQLTNGFDDGTFGPLPSVYFTTTAGSWGLKGIGYRFDLTVNAVPEPAGISALVIALVAGACCGRGGRA
jgi:hypothetical protein